MLRTIWQSIGMLAVLAGTLAIVLSASAVPLPADKKVNVVADRAGFIPIRKQLEIPGKIVAVLLSDAQPVLSTEGRSGPPDQLCVSWNGGSYRWVYVPVVEKPMIKNLQIPLPEGKTKVYPSLSMASPTTVKGSGIDALYSLVEVEVNGGAGSPANDALVATKLTKLDGSKRYPIQVATVIAEVRKQYEAHLSEKQKDLDAAMDEAAKKAIKERKPTGPREKNTLMFVTWMPEGEKLVVRFLTRFTDGDYKYGGGINIELPPPPVPPGPPQGGPAPPPRRLNGLRYGTQFGVEFGAEFTVSKAGKVENIKMLEPQSFSKELPRPPAFENRPRPLPLPPQPVPAR